MIMRQGQLQEIKEIRKDQETVTGSKDKHRIKRQVQDQKDKDIIKKQEKEQEKQEG